MIHIFYRIIQIGNKKIFVKLGYLKKLKINGRKNKFVFYPNQSISIFRGYILRRFITNISEKTKETKMTLNDTKSIISKVKEIEIGVFFKLISNIEKIINDEDILENIIGYKKLVYIGFVSNEKISTNLLSKLKK